MRLLVIVGLLLGAAAARAEEPADVAALLADGDKRYADLDYRGAAEVAERAAKDPRATQGQRCHGWQRVGLSWLVMGQRNLAREAFDALFSVDSTLPIEDASLSPRQREFIEEVRKHHPAKPKSVVDPTPDPKPDPVVAPVVTPPSAVAPAKKPVWKRWYLWTPIAIGLVGLGVGLGLGLGLHSSPTGTLGTVGLGLRF